MVDHFGNAVEADSMALIASEADADAARQHGLLLYGLITSKVDEVENSSLPSIISGTVIESGLPFMVDIDNY